MTGTLKTKIIRQYEHGTELQPYVGTFLTNRRFRLVNGVWFQVHVYEPETIALWQLPEPGEFVKRVRSEGEVGAS